MNSALADDMHLVPDEDSPSVSQIVTQILLATIAIGTAVRFLFPFFFNPMTYVYSDQARHLSNALNPINHSVLNAMDPIGYQIWLDFVLRVTGPSPTAVAVYAGLLSAVTPWIWYRWMREVMQKEIPALIGWAFLCWLPQWMRIYSYFMAETLLLTVTGLALWMGWRARRLQTPGAVALAGLCFGAAAATKPTMLMLMGLVGIWLLITIAREQRWTTGLSRFGLFCLCVGAIYMLTPLKVYNRIGIVDFVPPGKYNGLYYQSGNKRIEMNMKYKDPTTGGIHTNVWWFESPSFYCPPFYPLSEWQSPRQGTYKLDLDFTKPQNEIYPPVNVPLSTRLSNLRDNAVFFFFGFSYPMDHPRASTTELLATMAHWLWLPFTLFVAAVAIVKRRCDMIIMLCLVPVFVFIFQQSFINEGRYRIAWEGIAVTAVLFCCEMLWLSRRKPVETGSAFGTVSSEQPHAADLQPVS